MDSERKAIIEAARQEAARMRAAISVSDRRPHVSMSVEQFGRLAELLEKLADTVAFWPEEDLDDPRYWVPLDHFRKVKTQADQCRAEIDRMNQDRALNEIFQF